MVGSSLMVAALSGCGSAPSAEPMTASYRSESADAAPAPATMDGAKSESARGAPAPESRPGLGTTWGETRSSRITSAPFVRADASSPFATGSLFYNDEEGARTMANLSGFKRTSTGSVELGGGVATMQLKDGSGRFLTGFQANNKSFVVGTAGDRYSIVITSHVPARLEVVVSVDGLDVLDGKPAGFQKRGYIIDPNAQIEIDGFRQSMDAVAAFRFGSVRDSYAERKSGDSRNVGVIGIALFNEQGTNPSSWPIRNDANQRLNADPFPGRFATPPN